MAAVTDEKGHNEERYDVVDNEVGNGDDEKDVNARPTTMWRGCN